MNNLSADEREVLRALQKNAKATQAQISALTNLHMSKVFRTLAALHERKVITRYVAVMNRKLLGFDFLAILLVKLEASTGTNLDKVAKYFDLNEQILECSRVLGEYDFCLKVVAIDSADYHRILREIADLPGVVRTTTLLVTEEDRSKNLPIKR